MESSASARVRLVWRRLDERHPSSAPSDGVRVRSRRFSVNGVEIGRLHRSDAGHVRRYLRRRRALGLERGSRERRVVELGSRRAARTFATVGIVPVFEIRRKSSWTASSSSVRSRLRQVASNSRQGGGTEHFTQRFRSARESRAVGKRGVFSSTPVRESDRYLVRHERNIGAHGRKHHDDSGGVVL